jgi:indolepyruvate ferredoxin oxidoreductase beta subunit
MHYNLLICGVGGQGILTLSEILGRAAVDSGLKAIVTMDRGLSQRGGSVKAHVRLGEVYAPMIPKFTAHGLLSLEIQETFNHLDYLNEDTAMVVSTTRVTSGTRTAANRDGSPDLPALLRRARPKGLLVVDAAARTFEQDGGGRTNIYLMGTVFGLDTRLAELLPLTIMSSAIQSVVRREAQKNLSLFRKGLEEGAGSR